MKPHTLPRQQLLLALTLALAPHVLHLPLWISGLYAAGLAWHALHLGTGLSLPGRWPLAAIAAGAAILILVSHGGFTGRDAGVALLSVMTALKLLEARRRRDYLLLALLGHFLILTQFLFDQGVIITLYSLGVFWLLTASLIQLSSPHPAGFGRRLRLAGRMVGLALVPAVVLFAVFPRPPAGLWGVQHPAGQATTGLSDRMSPGDISDLSQSGAIAFRADFQGDIPPRDDLDWRGPVLWHFDGRTWHPRERPMECAVPHGSGFGEPVRYDIILEPHGRPWLFALDIPARVPEGARLTRDLQLLHHADIEFRHRYRAASYTDYQLNVELSARDRTDGLRLPQDGDPRLRQLGRQWARDSQDAREVIDRALRFFAEQGFRYTLSPGRLPETNPMDHFLFQSRAGFCEHYAGAFTLLMRAAGIPARVVTGYQGGERNPNGGHLIVRQADAHAWTEVWLPASGWTRVDPTTAVSPQRLQSGLAASVTDPETLPAPVRLDRGWLHDAQLAWDGANHRWNRWVLGYSSRDQNRLLDWLRLPQLPPWGLALLSLVVGLAVLGIFLRLAPRPRIQSADSEVERWYRRYCRQLARQGLLRQPAEGPWAFAERVSKELPEAGARARRIADLYVRLRYAPNPPADGLRRLRELVRGR